MMDIRTAMNDITSPHRAQFQTADMRRLHLQRLRRTRRTTPRRDATLPASIATRRLGEHITAGMRRSSTEQRDAWTATLTKLERPGVVASMFFAQGLREVTLRLDDGRTARARIAGTTFVAASERVCHLIGLEPLANATARSLSLQHPRRLTERRLTDTLHRLTRRLTLEGTTTCFRSKESRFSTSRASRRVRSPR